jgi:Ser/Thr protein kinase RdoA (MazF antagonist)
MKAFEDLTPRVQIRRLRRSAQAALQQHGPDDARLVFVAYSENAVFRVETPRERYAPYERYALRVHRPGHQTKASLHVSEILWAIDLAQHNPGFRQELDGWLEWAALHIARYQKHKEAL